MLPVIKNIEAWGQEVADWAYSWDKEVIGINGCISLVRAGFNSCPEFRNAALPQATKIISDGFEVLTDLEAITPPPEIKTPHTQLILCVKSTSDYSSKMVEWGGKHYLDTKRGHSKVGSFIKVEYSTA